MAELATVFVRTLSDLPETWLEEITADGATFANLTWMKLLERVSLTEIAGGSIELSFAVVLADQQPIAICPLIRASGAGLYFVYSLRRYFFEHWIEEAIRLAPQRKDYFTKLFAGVSTYRRLLEWTNTPLDDCWIVTNPLSYRSQVAIAPSTETSRREILDHLCQQLRALGRRTRRPLWFLCVEGEKTPLAGALADAGFTRAFQFYDNRIELEGFTKLDDYLAGFSRTTRRAFQKDIRRTKEAGVTFEFRSDFTSLAPQFANLYEQTYSQYGNSYFRQPSEFWQTLQRTQGIGAEAILAWRQGELIGFSILLRNDRRGEMWTYRIGRDQSDLHRDIPFYFGLSFYGPIERAIEAGYRRLWLGPASYEAKSVRGAKQIPLYSYFWFPRPWDRWALAPYLKLFGQITREQIDATLVRPADSENPTAKSKPKSQPA